MFGLGKIVVLSGIIGLIAYFSVSCRNCYLFNSPSVPVLKDDVWWGPGEPKKLGDSISSFKINVSDQVILDLHSRLDRYLKDDVTPPLENQGFQYGFNTNYLKEVVTYWRKKYDWKRRQNYLNQYPHFKTFVNGLDMHFILVKPQQATGKKVLPLLLLHGWPGSVREFYDIIPMLTTPRKDVDFVFQVIVPSLPGYGFSSGASKTGLGPAEIAVVMKNLMSRLGFEQFYVQGGDWGAAVAKCLSVLYPERVLGMHSNFCITFSFSSLLKWLLGSLAPSYMVPEKYQHKMYPIKNVLKELFINTGHMHIHATSPDTIGTALNDSPVGLAAHILEKFSKWTDPSFKTLPDGGLTKRFTLDALLDNVMIYWISGSIMTSQRLYAEAFSETNNIINMLPVHVPTVCARFVNELGWYSKCQLSATFKNFNVTDHDNAGHFAAMEAPKTLSEDVWSAVANFESYHASQKQNV